MFHLIIKKIIGNRWILLIVLSGIIVASLYSFIFYPSLKDEFNAALDSDRWGDLGKSVYKYGMLSYYPENSPSIERGPIYPIFLALILKIFGESSWPYNIQIVQNIFFGLICLIIFLISKKLFNIKTAYLSPILLIIYPCLVWFTGRIWVEILLTFLFTCLIGLVVRLYFKPNNIDSFWIGLMVGICALCKATFLPFVLLLPVFLLIIPKDKPKINIKHALIIFLISVLTIFPWTIRNFLLTGEIIPVQVLTGYNLFVGDKMVDYFEKSPLSYYDGFADGFEKYILPAYKSFPEKTKRAEIELAVDSTFTKMSVDRYLSDPLFFIKKIALNSLFFWFLAGSVQRTLICIITQLPFLIFFILAVIRLAKQSGLRNIYGVLLASILTYFLSHLPILAKSRYSVVLIPVMIMFIADYMLSNFNVINAHFFRSKKIENVFF